ncbi:MAG: hypothetical protein AAF125_04605 [Chloroflexota bacterium]
MSKRYTLDEKRHVLKLMKHYENAAAVSRETGIPARTIRDWVYEASKRQNIMRLRPVSHPASYYQGNADITPDQLRDRLLKQLDALTQNMESDPRSAYYASLTITRLLDQIERLNSVLKSPPPSRSPQ